MKLYNLGMSPNALRVRAVINELGLDVEIIDVDFRDPSAKSAMLLPVNPNTKVPVLVDGDFVLWESYAIDAYLAASKPEAGLYPTDLRKRATIDQWSYWNAVHLGPALGRLAMERFIKAKFGRGGPDQAMIDLGLMETARFLKVLDDHLAGREWVADDLSIADFGIAAAFAYRAPSEVSLDSAPNVAAWLARVEARPSWQKAAAPINAFIG